MILVKRLGLLFERTNMRCLMILRDLRQLKKKKKKFFNVKVMRFDR